MYVWMWCKISKNDIVCTIRNNLCTLLRNSRREKTLGEMWAAVIKTMDNLLWMAWLQTRAPQMGTEPGPVDAQKGTMKDIFARCLKKNIAQVCTLLRSCAYCKEEFQLTINLTSIIAEKKLTSWKSQWLHYWHMRKLLVTANILFDLFHVQICRVICRMITDVYFSVGYK